MSTYTDLHNKIKETVTVDYHSRITPMEVKFLNPRNEYLGTFTGETIVTGGDLKNVTITNATVTSAILDNVYFKNGLVLDNIVDDIQKISNDLCTEVCDRATGDMCLLSILSSVEQDLNEKISDESSRAHAIEQILSVNIYKEADKRILADQILSSELTKEIIKQRHLSLNNINDRTYPIKLQDYSINTYKANTPNAYVYTQMSEKPIGRIQNSIFDFENDQVVYKSFDLYVFENTEAYELTAFGKTTYHFDAENTLIYTGVGGYRIEWKNVGCGIDGELQFYVDSGNKYGFYPVKFETTLNEAGLLQAGDGNIVIDNDGIVQRCKFTVTSHALSNFVRPYPFEINNNQVIHFNGLDGSMCEIGLKDNHFTLKDGTSERYYMGLSSNSVDVFAKIYENDIVIDPFDNLESMTINMDNRKYLLNEANEFKDHVRGSNPYRVISYSCDDKKVRVVDDKKQYQYKFVGNNSYIIPGDDEFEFNKQLFDAYDFITLYLNFEDETEPYLNTKYQLSQSLKDPYIYETKEQFDDIKIRIEFDKQKCILNMFIFNPSASSKGHIQLTLNQGIYKINDYSTTLFTSQEIDVFAPVYDSIEKTSKNTYQLFTVPKSSEMSGETKEYECKSSIQFRDQIDLILPDKHQQIPEDFEHFSMQYLINFKITDNGKYSNQNNVVRLNLISHDLKDKFYYLNRPVKNIYLLKNAYSTLKFDEVQPHKFIITDLDQSELDFRTNALRDRLSSDEILVAQAITDLSSEISSNNNDISALSDQIDVVNGKVDSLCSEFMIISTDFDNRISSNELSIEDLYGRIRGGLVYRGTVDVNESMTTFHDILFNYYKDPSVPEVETDNIELRNGYFYIVKATDSTVHYDIEGVKVTNKDFIIIKENILLKDVNKTNVGMMDAMDSDCVRLSTFVETSAYLNDKIDFILSIDMNNVSYQGVMQKYEPSDPQIETNYRLSAFINKSLNPEFGGRLKYGFMFKLSSDQLNPLYDANNDTVRLGANDFFIINNNIDVKDILTSNLDIFRNAESEASALFNDLTSQINAVSTYLSNDLTSQINAVSTYLSTDYCQKIKISYDNTIEYVNKVSTALSNDYINKIDIALNESKEYTDEEVKKEAAIRKQNDETLSDYLSTDYTQKIQDLSSEVNNRVNEISSHYDKTFEKDYPIEILSPEVDVSVDLLKLTDESIDPTFNGKKYTMHLSCGTIVLVPITK